jgi:hypothetical protein
MQYGGAFAQYVYLLGCPNVHVNSELLWRLSDARNSTTYLHLHVKWPLVLPGVNQLWISSTGFHKSSQNQILRKSV